MHYNWGLVARGRETAFLTVCRALPSDEDEEPKRRFFRGARTLEPRSGGSMNSGARDKESFELTLVAWPGGDRPVSDLLAEAGLPAPAGWSVSSSTTQLCAFRIPLETPAEDVVDFILRAVAVADGAEAERWWAKADP